MRWVAVGRPGGEQLHRLMMLAAMLAPTMVKTASSARRARRVLVFTGSVAPGSENRDCVHLYVDGWRVLGTPAAGGIKAAFRIPDSQMPVGVPLCGAEFSEVPEGPARIHVQCACGDERYYCVSIGGGYTIPWHASWKYRGWEAYWCGR